MTETEHRGRSMVLTNETAWPGAKFHPGDCSIPLTDPWRWAALLLAHLALLLAGALPARAVDIIVNTPSEITIKAAQANPGDTLVMRDGVWNNADILLNANGSAAAPITLRPQTLGAAHLTGASRLRIAGSHLVVDGLVFTNGYVSSGDVIAFQDTTFSVAVNCRITNCVIIDYNPPNTTIDTKWVSMYGFSNRVENCYFKGKSNLGTTLIVWVDANRPNYHQIRRNYFGPRPPYPANGAETIRIGTSDVSLSNSRSTVEENFFEQCNGDAEIISSKSCENIYRNNTFIECEGALSLRHGNRCTVEGNYFFGRHKPLTGGVRIVGEDHKVFNNYFAELAGTSARSPISIMQGLVNSPLNGYAQVFRATVAFNTFVDCTNAFHSGLVGTLSGSGDTTTLPPVDCTIANNIVLQPAGKIIDQRIVPVNMTYEGNFFFGTSLGITNTGGNAQVDPQLILGTDGLWRPGPTSPALGAAQGNYPYVTTDIEGQLRPATKDAGCDQFSAAPTNHPPLRAVDVGPLWTRASGTVLGWNPPAPISYGTPLTSAQLNAVANVPGTFAYEPPAGTLLPAGSARILSVVFTPNDVVSYSAATQTVTIDVLKAVPAISWPHPASIVYGTALSSTQLNATAQSGGAPLAGTFSYSPPAGTILNVGSNQVLSTVFTPADTTNYEIAARAVTLNVLLGVPVLAWANPAPVPSGTLLGPDQLNATASVPGTFEYTPPEGTLLSAGSGQILSVQFTPNDTLNYASATRTVTINVTLDGKFVPIITWQNPADIPFGTALSSTQLNASANIPGTFIYDPPAGTVLPIGNAQVLSVTFTPANTTTYTNATRTTFINVAPPLSRATLRVAYLIPTNRTERSHVLPNLREALLTYQTWFREQMLLNGFGPKTIAIETEPDGVTPLIHVFRLSETDSYLRGDIFGGRITNAARAAGVPLGDPGQIWWLVPETHLMNPDGSLSGSFDLGHSLGGSGDEPGWALMSSDNLAFGGTYEVPLTNTSGVITGMLHEPYLTNAEFYAGQIFPQIGPYALQQGLSFSWFDGSTLSSLSSSALGAGLREIAEALGLDPDYRNDENFDGNLTGFGFRGIRGVIHPKLYPYNYARLPYGAALALDVSRYFNPGRPVTDTTRPTAAVMTTGSLAPVEGLMRITFSAGDAGGLHAALLCWEQDDERVLVDEMILSGTNVTRTFTTPYYETGRTNRYTVSIYDQQGNMRSVAASVFPTAAVNRAPQPFIQLRPVVAGPGENVALDASRTFDPEHSASLLEVEWDFDGDGVFDTEPSTEMVFTNRYFNYGHRLIRARITDAAGDQAISAPVALSIVPCSARVSPTARAHGYGATSGGITVTNVGARCEWVASTTNDWITITNGATGIGPGRITYALTENPELGERVGYIFVGDTFFTVRQASFACTFSLSPTSRNHGFGTGTGTVKVNTKPDCSWTTVNTNSWIQVTSGSSGNGTGTLAYAVLDNRVAAARTGYLTIAGQPFAITQWGTNCTFIVTPASRSHSEGAETGLVAVASSSACAWNIVNTNDWITLNTPSGAGSASIGYSVLPNQSFVARSGYLELAGQSILITQAPCSFDISPASRTHGSGVEVGTVNITTAPTCSWTVTNTAPWVTLIGSPSGAGNGTFTYSLAANPVGSIRTATFYVGNKTFTVTQLGIPCAYQVTGETAGEGSEPEAFHGEGAEVGVIEIITGAGCPVYVDNPADWIHILSGLPPGGGPASGSTTIIYSIDPNTGPARYAFLSVGAAGGSAVVFQVHQASGLRVVRAENLLITGGNTNWMPILLDGHGTENRLDLSLCYDTNLLMFCEARVASGAFGGSLSVNSNSPGRIGLSLAMPPGWSIPDGNQRVMEVCLKAAAVSGRPQTPVTLCDTPVLRSLNDVLGQPVAVEYHDALIRIFGDCSPAEALDAPQFTWVTSSSTPWTCQTNTTHDFEDAAISPILPDSGDSWIEATFTGPGALRWWWKVSSEPGSDRLRLYLDGSSQSAYILSGEVDWEQRTFTVPAGNHVVRWRYNKNSSVAAGQDRAWLDQIEFEPSPPIISAHPASRSVEVGATLSLGVTAAGAPPLGYRWRLNGNELFDSDRIRGAATPTLTISNAQFADAGSYSVVVSSTAGSTVSSNALVSVTPHISLAEAADALGLAWATNGSPPWAGQGGVSHDGVDAAQSGAIPDSGTTTLRATVSGPGTLSYWWKVSSQAGSDRLRLYTNNTQAREISGEVDWTFVTQAIGSGAQTIEWRYTKNGSTSVGQDRAWVDEVQFLPLPPAITSQPLSQAADVGASVTFTVGANGAPPLAYQWRFNGDDLVNGPGVSGATSATLTLSSVQLAQAGDYSVEVRNASDAVLSASAALAVSPVLPLGEALDAPGLLWTTTGTPAWAGQNAVTHDGADAARSGAIGHSGDTRFSTTVTGPGSVSFWWKVSSEPANDRFRFYIAGSAVAEISGEVDWQWRSFNLGSGNHVLEWRYNKSTGVSLGQDRAWVDQVIIVTNGAAVAPVLAIEPFNQTVVAGSAVSLRALAAGSAPIGYQWRLNGTNLLNGGGFSGVTATNLSIASAQAAHAGTYSVVASNVAGTASSSNVTLTVITAPVITNPPANQHVVAGSTVTFNVGAIGLAPLGYQWLFNGSNLVNGGGVSGATTATLTLTAVQASREGLYSVVVSNAAGTASSSHASGNLSTLDAARTGATADDSDTLLETTVAGPGSVRFWWKVSSETNSDPLRFLVGGVEQAAISGETDWRQESFPVAAGVQTLQWIYSKNGSAAAGQDGGWVDGLEFVPDGPVSAPAIAVEPASQEVLVSSTIAFHAAVTGTPPLSFQWRFNGAPLENGENVSGARTPLLTLLNVQPARAGNYSLVVSNAAGNVTTVDAALTVTTPVVATNGLSISSQPANRVAGQGGSTTFSATVAGQSPLVHQWWFSPGSVNGNDTNANTIDRPLADGDGVSGATTTALTLHNLSTAQEGVYRLVVSNATGTITSAPAGLAMLSLADAVDAPYWEFVMAGNTSWVAQTSLSHDGMDAARSGAIADGQNTRLETWVQGPGTVSFWWKVSSQASVDQLRFYVGSNELARISGEVDWQRLSFAVPAGTQLLKWRYSKDTSGTGGQDAGWVDQVEFTASGAAVAPAVVSQPTGQSVQAGEMASFAAEVAGSAPMSFQWRSNGVPLQNGAAISGATSPRLTLLGVQPSQAANYSLSISNAAGTVSTEVATLSVAPVISAPLITSQPQTRSVSEGAGASFNVTASGSGPLAYQWFFNGQPLADGGGASGTQTPTLTLANAGPQRIGSYWAVVSNAMGTATSARAGLAVLTLADAVDAPYLEFATGGSNWTALTGVTHERGGARLTVSTPPAITAQPAPRTVQRGAAVAFTVGTSGSAPLSYQWRFNGANLADGPAVSGATSASVSLSDIQAAQAGNYSVLVSNAVGAVTSSNALLTVLLPPSISTQPASQTVAEGVTVVLSVAASGTGPLSYQWRYNGTNIANGGSVSGATSATLSLANAQFGQTGAYSVLVSNAVGTAVSADATVLIRAPLSLGDALNSPGLSWSTSISTPWQAQTNVTVDGEGATRSGAVSTNQATWIETTVMGPGTVRFWWKVSSQTNGDVLRFLLAGMERDRISGEVDWTWRSFDVPAGLQTLRWAYSKDASVTLGQDRGWLDQVEFVPVVGPTVPVITMQPVGAELTPGGNITFLAEAVGTPPLSYQWTHNGVNLLDSETVSGAASPALTLQNVSAGREGTYQLVVRNNYSLAVSSNAFLRVLPFIPLSDALDTGTTNMLWISGGASAWFGQNDTAHDRVDAAQSGALTHNRTNWMESSVAGPISVSFWWRTSSETNRDRLRFYINNVEQGNLSGETGWRWRTFDVNHLTATLRWAYTKDATGSAGLDRAWVDEITTGPMAPVITNGPNDITLVDAGTTIKLRVDTAGTPPFGFQWRMTPNQNGTGATNLLESTNFWGAETSRTLAMTNAMPWQSGVYSVMASNAAGVSLSETGHVVIRPGLPLPPALNTPTWVWRTGGDAHWVGDSSDSHDGSQSARNGVIVSSSSGGATWMETTLVGAGTLRFWWKVSSRTNQDYARFYVNGVELAAISGTVNWQQKMFDLDVGTNIARWEYARNGILTNGQNRAWVDEVFFGPLPPTITNQPAGRAVDAGSTVVLNVGVRGTPPLSYRWRLNGVNLNDGNGISGATTATLTLANIQTAQAGNYSVLIQNSIGSATSSNAVVSVTPVLPLAEALDTTTLTWTTSGSSGASAVWVGQPTVSHDGVDAARIQGLGDGQSANFQATVVGPATVSFWWRVSSQANSDFLRFYIDGVEQAGISGEVNWQVRSFNIPEGSVPLRWTYSKNGSVVAGQDRAWVDQVVISATAPFITSQPASQSVDESATVTFSVAAGGTPPLSYQWRFNGVNLADGGNVSGATTTTLRLTGVSAAQAGSYSVVVRNEAAAVTSASATLSVATVVPLATALDTSGLTWTTNGNPPWVGQTAVSHDGVDAARSGAIPDSGTTSFSTTVAGPGTVTFWWKVSSQAGSDRLRFYVNGSQVTEISGEVDWTLMSHNVGSGNQTLEWRYTKNGSTSVGQDRGWVDEVRFGQLPPTIATQPVSRSVEAGSTVSFGVTAGGTPSLVYQWLRNGSPLANGSGISGATASNLTLTAVQVAQAGNYSVVVSNAAGSVTSASATLAVSATNSLAQALDTTGLTWTTSGDATWVGQAVESHDGVDAARTGVITHSEDTSMFTTVTGPGTLTFWWKVSSQAGSDRLRFYVNGTQVTEISGEVDWTLYSRNLGSGTQTLEWRYTKNSSTTVGQDRGWVDEVRFGPAAPVITTQPASQSVNAGSTVTLSVIAVASPPVSYQWRYGGANIADGDNISGATTDTLSIDAVQLAQAGNYTVVVTSGGISTTSSVAVLTVVPVIPLTDALDGADLIWTTGGSVGNWSGQNAVNHDGVDAAQSGIAGASQYTWIKTSVTGPGTLTFWWKVSSEANRDFLRLMLNGVDQRTISGEVDWQFQTFPVPAGSQELQWRFSHNSSIAAGQDRAWVDQVAYTPDAAPSPLPPGPIADPGTAPDPVPPGSSPAPVVSKIEVIGTKAILTWDARPTKTYQVVYKDNLNDPAWLVLDGEVLIRWKIEDDVVVSDSVIASMEDVLAGKTRYYRVVEY